MCVCVCVCVCVCACTRGCEVWSGGKDRNRVIERGITELKNYMLINLSVHVGIYQNSQWRSIPVEVVSDGGASHWSRSSCPRHGNRIVTALDERLLMDNTVDLRNSTCTIFLPQICSSSPSQLLRRWRTKMVRWWTLNPNALACDFVDWSCDNYYNQDCNNRSVLFASWRSVDRAREVWIRGSSAWLSSLS